MASHQQGSLGPPASCKDSPSNGQGGHAAAGLSPLNAELLVAARKGNTDQVERCLREGGGAGAATTDKHGRTCLHLASHYGHVETVSAILRTGLIDINCASKRGNTPLHEASAEGRVSVVLLLLAHGAYLKARNRDGGTCLMLACQSGQLQVARILIAAGSDPTATNTGGYTALHVAAMKGHSSIVELLLIEGVALTAEAANGKTAFQLAQEEKHHEIMTIIQAAQSRESEEPFYRIASLEGQLRRCQDKLREVQMHHEATLAAERAAEEERWVQVTQQLTIELETANTQLASLQKSTASNSSKQKKQERLLPAEDGPMVTLSAPDLDEKSPKSKSTGRNKKISNLLLDDIEVQRKGSLGSAALVSPKLIRSSRPKSGSQETLDSLGIDKHRDVTARVLDGEKGNGKKRPSISQLIADNSNNPQSMAAIRKELKSDGLTPKLQRKFHHNLITSQSQDKPRGAS